MPELKKWEGDKTLGLKIDMSKYEYKDKVREKARLLAMEEAKDAAPYVPSEDALRRRRERRPWSQKHKQHDLKEQRREKKKRKREVERLEKMTPAELEKERELQALIEEVKRRKKVDEETEFEGFGD
jgi:ATP-dependent RNA helicase DDX55/SPB4